MEASIFSVKRRLVFSFLLILFSFLFLPQTQKVFSAPKRGIVVSGTKKVLTIKNGVNVFFGEKTIDLDLMLHGRVVEHGVKWWTKNNKTIKVDSKGKLYPLKNGRAVVVARYKNIDFRILVLVGTKPEAIILTENLEEGSEEEKAETEEIIIGKGELKRFTIKLPLSERVIKAGGKKASSMLSISLKKKNAAEFSFDEKNPLSFELKGEEVGDTKLELLADYEGASKKDRMKKMVLLRVIPSVEAEWVIENIIKISGENLSSDIKSYQVIDEKKKVHELDEIEYNEKEKSYYISLKEELENGSYTLIFGDKKAQFGVLHEEEEEEGKEASDGIVIVDKRVE